jgi:hypothetical protein
MLKDAHLGWSYLEYEDGWPAAKAVENSGMANRPKYILSISALIGTRSVNYADSELTDTVAYVLM